MILRLLLVAAVTSVLTSASQAAIVLDYISIPSTANATIAPNTTGTGVTGANLMTGGGLTANNGSTYNWRAWDGTDVATALAAGDFFEWGFTSTSAYNLDDLDIRYDRSGNGPQDVDIQLSINGGAFTSIHSATGISPGGNTVADIDLTSFDDVTSATFRLFAFNATNGNGTFDVENAFNGAAIVVNGTLSAVPEPASLVMVGVALALFWCVRSRCRLLFA